MSFICANGWTKFWPREKAGKGTICQCTAQTSLAHWAQPNILQLQFTHFACTAHIPSLYKALFCTLLYTHQYTDYSVFLSHFILLTLFLRKSFNGYGEAEFLLSYLFFIFFFGGLIYIYIFIYIYIYNNILLQLKLYVTSYLIGR